MTTDSTANAVTNWSAEVIRRATRDGAEAFNAVARVYNATLNYTQSLECKRKSADALDEARASNPHSADGPDRYLKWAWDQGFAWAKQAFGMGQGFAHMPLMCSPYGDFGPFSEAYALGRVTGMAHDDAETKRVGAFRADDHNAPGPDANLLGRLAVAQQVQAAALDELDGHDDALARIATVADDASDEHGVTV